jgi:hypothetical protein
VLLVRLPGRHYIILPRGHHVLLLIVGGGGTWTRLCTVLHFRKRLADFPAIPTKIQYILYGHVANQTLTSLENLTCPMKYPRNFGARGKHHHPPPSRIGLPTSHTLVGLGTNIFYHVPINRCFRLISHTFCFLLNQSMKVIYKSYTAFSARSIYSPPVEKKRVGRFFRCKDFPILLPLSTYFICENVASASDTTRRFLYKSYLHLSCKVFQKV